LDPEDVRNLSLEAIWNFSKGTGQPWLGIRVWGTKDWSKGLDVSGPQGLKPNYYYYYYTLPTNCSCSSSKVSHVFVVIFYSHLIICKTVHRLLNSEAVLTLRSKAYACCRLTAGITGSNPAEGMNVRLLCLLCR
jgi:hypothetical protein